MNIKCLTIIVVTAIHAVALAGTFRPESGGPTDGLYLSGTEGGPTEHSYFHSAEAGLSNSSNLPGTEPDSPIDTVQALQAVGISGGFIKDRPINHLIYSSGRSFSAEEANRYAGSLGDVGRMVRNYAGVLCLDDSRNDIIIRGNSPSNLLWRIDGFEVANPNHFGSIGLTGSSVSMLNSNLIRNSDFITGAFPAEYGNALGGVFDIRLKEAPRDRHHFRAGAGWNGFELGAEGPVSSTGGYQVCYRYSFLDAMAALGMETGLRPKFQDLTVRGEVPLSESWKLSLLAMGGDSRISLSDSQIETGSRSLFSGIGFDWSGQRSAARISLSANDMESQYSVVNSNQDTRSTYSDREKETDYALSVRYENRQLDSHYLSAGATLHLYDMDFRQINRNDYCCDSLMFCQETMLLGRIFVQDEYLVSEKLAFTLGADALWLSLNGSHAIGPRAGMLWRPGPGHQIGLSYGRHHQTQVHTLYLYGSGNRQLDFSQADHLSLTHHWRLGQHWRLKTDLYGQNLRNIPVEADAPSAFSALNIGADFYLPLRDGLTSQGLGRNYGVEMTLEKFMSDHWYGMLNGTLARSEYTGSDGIWRSTAYDIGYMANALGGYSFGLPSNWFNWAGKRSDSQSSHSNPDITPGSEGRSEGTDGIRAELRTDLRITCSGGRPFTPVDEALSQALGTVVYDEDHTNCLYAPAYFRCDWRLALLVQTDRFQFEMALDLQNLTNHYNLLYSVYSPSEKLYYLYWQTLFYPMYTFKLCF